MYWFLCRHSLSTQETVICHRGLLKHVQAKEQNRELRDAWQIKLSFFMDESAANERTGDRKRGWAPVGVPCVEQRSAVRSEKVFYQRILYTAT